MNNLPFTYLDVDFKPFYVEYDESNFEKPNSLNSISIISVGKLEERKKLHLSMMTAFELAKLQPDLKVNISVVYSWKNKNSDRIKNEIHDYKNEIVGKAQNLTVNLHCEISNKIVRQLMASADIYLHPADCEPASYAIVEAYAMGCFVICKKDCLTAEYLDEKNFIALDVVIPNKVSNHIAKNISDIKDMKLRVERRSKIKAIFDKII